jgi:hypothetical protein
MSAPCCNITIEWEEREMGRWWRKKKTHRSLFGDSLDDLVVPNVIKLISSSQARKADRVPDQLMIALSRIPLLTGLARA